VECNDTSDQRRQIYDQHQVICFHCKKEKEFRTAIAKNPRKWKDQVNYGQSDAWLPAKALISSFTFRFGTKLNTSCKKNRHEYGRSVGTVKINPKTSLKEHVYRHHSRPGAEFAV
jgi:hypothetical protein